MNGAFNISNLPVLNAFLKIDPQGIPDRDSLSFESCGKEELKVLHDFYGTGQQEFSKEEWCKLTHWNLEILKVTSPNKKSFFPRIRW